MVYLLTERRNGGDVEYIAASPTFEFCERLQDEKADELVKAGNLPPKVESYAETANRPIRRFTFDNVVLTIWAIDELKF